MCVCGGRGRERYYITRGLTALISEATVAVVAKISKDKILAPSRFTLEKVGSFSNRVK